MTGVEGGGRTALVTGCAGFLGVHLTTRLLADGWRVIGLDNLATGQRAHIASFADDDRFRFMEADVTKPFREDVDLVVNLAAIAAPLRYGAAPIETFRTGVLGAIHAGDAAVAAAAPVLHASTSEVYGSSSATSLREDDWGQVNPVGPRACYAESKRAAETVLTDMARGQGLDLRLARIFNVYGPGMDPDDGRVVPTFLRQALTGAPLTVHGDGRQTRSFCFVDDAIEALRRFATAEAPGPAPINIGNPEEMSVLELAETVLSLTGSRSEIVFAPAPPDDPPRRKPDISRARTTLDWSPGVDLAEGLARTAAAMDRTLTQEGDGPGGGVS